MDFWCSDPEALLHRHFCTAQAAVVLIEVRRVSNLALDPVWERFPVLRRDLHESEWWRNLSSLQRLCAQYEWTENQWNIAVRMLISAHCFHLGPVDFAGVESIDNPHSKSLAERAELEAMASTTRRMAVCRL